MKMQDLHYLRPQDAAEFLQKLVGIGNVRTLANLRVTGGGPTFRKLGKSVIYAPEDLRSWVLEKMTPALESTSQQIHPNTGTIPTEAALSLLKSEG
jgi:hypothetical protein